jgi:outer membrane protein assembly factor BamD
MRNLLVIAIVLFLVGCKSAFEDTLASRDVQKKENLAFKLYESKDYYKAGELFKSLIQDKKSGEDIEEMFFYYAMCDYKLEDFGLAAYEFERLIQKFPRGKYNEESQYYIAMANYKKSPPHFLDQDYTYRAIESFQLFLDKYPQSEKRNEVNTKVDELTDKLEYKMYKQAKLFYHMEEYKSATIALEGVVSEFPDSKHAEEIYFLIAESNFKLAKKSVEYKQIDRFNKAVKSSGYFIKKFKESEYTERAEAIIDRSKEEIVELKLELPEYYQKNRRL